MMGNFSFLSSADLFIYLFQKVLIISRVLNGLDPDQDRIFIFCRLLTFF